MPRSPTGEYTLPLPPVISGATIEADWANTTLADITVAMTDSTSRTAQGSMQAPLKLVDGTKSAPGLAFVNEANTGFYRPDAGDLYVSVLGVDYMRWTDDNGVQFSVDGTNWLDVADKAEVLQNEVNIDINAADIAALQQDIITSITWADNVLSHVRVTGNFDVTLDTFTTIKSDGTIRHKSALFTGVTVLADVNTQTRFTLINNNGPITLTFDRPTGIDPDLGDDYCVEGSVLITNGANNPGTITINNDAGAVPATKILGAQNTNLDAVMVLSYLIHRQNGDSYQEVYSWCT